MNEVSETERRRVLVSLTAGVYSSLTQNEPSLISARPSASTERALLPARAAPS